MTATGRFRRLRYEHQENGGRRAVRGRLARVASERPGPDELNKLTYLTFGQDGGDSVRSAPARTHSDWSIPSEPNIVQIFNQTGTQVIAHASDGGDQPPLATR